MNKQTFAKGMEYLNTYYVNLKINLDNPMVIEIWFDVFKHMEDENFINLIKNYCLENIYAPQSPTSILEFAKQKYLENQPQAELEFEKVVELNKRYSLRINEDTIMAKIDSEITRSVLKAFKNDFINIGDDNRDMVKKRFITQFNSLLKANSIERTNGLVGIEKNKLLGE